MSFAWLRLCQIAFLAVCLTVLSACGGGGGGEGTTATANMTVTSGSFYLTPSTYDSKDSEVQTDTITGLGQVQYVLYDFGGFVGGVTFPLSDPQVFSIIVSPVGSSFYYSCVSEDWVTMIGPTAVTCPSTAVINEVTRRLQFTDAVLQRSDLPSDTVTVSGAFSW